MLIQYRVAGSRLRFGYIHDSALKNRKEVPELQFEAVPVFQDNQFVTDNPLGEGSDILLTGEGNPMTRLCTMGEGWMYVELALPGGESARMFAGITPTHV